MKNNSFAFNLGVLLLVLVLSYTGYIYWQNGNVDAQISVLTNEVSQAGKKVLNYENENVTEAISAQKTIEVLRMDDLKWSQIIRDMRKTIPTNQRGEPILNVVSYSGAADGKISVNISTVPGTSSAYFDVADLIEAFDKSDNFRDNFVSSVAKAVDADNNEILTFSLSTNYMSLSVADQLNEADAAANRSIPR